MPLPPDLDNLSIPFQPHAPGHPASHHHHGHPLHPHLHPQAQQQHQQQQQIDEIDSDCDDIEDVVGESDQESEGEEDLPLEMDDGRSSAKVSGLGGELLPFSSRLHLFFCGDNEDDGIRALKNANALWVGLEDSGVKTALGSVGSQN